MAALGEWGGGAVFIAPWEALSSSASTSVTIFLNVSLIIDLGSILCLSFESVRESGEAAS